MSILGLHIYSDHSTTHEQGRRLPPDTDFASSLILDFPVSRTVRKKPFFFISNPILWYFCYSSPNRLRHSLCHAWLRGEPGLVTGIHRRQPIRSPVPSLRHSQSSTAAVTGSSEATDPSPDPAEGQEGAPGQERARDTGRTLGSF